MQPCVPFLDPLLPFWLAPERHDMSTITMISVSSLRPAPARTDATKFHQRWPVLDVEALYALPFMDLLFRAQQVHREHFDANEGQLSTLLSIKTCGCPRACRLAAQTSPFTT